MYDLIGETDRKGDRDPKHRAEEIIRICDVTGNKKLTKEEVNFYTRKSFVFYTYPFIFSSLLDAKTIQLSVDYSYQTLKHDFSQMNNLLRRFFLIFSFFVIMFMRSSFLFFIFVYVHFN